VIRRTLNPRRGGALLESALWVPIVFTLFMGTVEIGRFTYTYYTLQKTMHAIAREVSVQQNVNFCNPEDPIINQVKTTIVAGGTPNTEASPVVGGLTAAMVEVRIERYSPATGNLAACECSATASGCDTSGGAQGPDYVVVTVPDGYPMTLRIPGILTDPIRMRPRVMVPFGGL
jgi:Flp pilus assembly protein TadG